VSDGNAIDDDSVDGDIDDADIDGGNDLPGAHAIDVLAYLVESIVEDPDGVGVELDDTGSRVRLNVTVSPGDMGRVIGKRGRVANAIRTVVRAAAVRDELEVDVEFVD
jgi:predicted RNA-binding protein YlqC (UPF0109 family)